MSSSSVSRVIKASPRAVYRAFLDPDALATWLPPDSMTGIVHSFDAREGGSFSLSLVYPDDHTETRGKTDAKTDTVNGRFVELLPDRKVVWKTRFDSPDPAFAGEMTLTVTLAPVGNGTEVTLRCDDIPSGIRPEDNEAGSRSSLENLAAFLEG